MLNWQVMRRANRAIAPILLLMAVLCSPAGVCVIAGMARTVQAAPTARAHACGKSMGGTFIAASEESCCTEQPTGLVTFLRITLDKHAAAPALEFDLAPAAPKRLLTVRPLERRVPLVLRI